MSNIPCDKEKVNEIKLHMLMLMNAWMMLVLMKCKCQMQCLTLGCYMQQLARDGYNFYYPTRDQMDSGRLSSVCSKNATAMPPPLCIKSRRHLFRWTPHSMVLANSTNFIEDMSWVHHRSKPLMTTTTTDTFFVHQAKAQRYPCAVDKSEKCSARSDERCSDHQVRTKIMVNVTLWTKFT